MTAVDEKADPFASLGPNLKGLREKKNWSKREVERRTHDEHGHPRVRSGHISQIENGDVTTPGLPTLRALAGAFDMTLGTFLRLLEVAGIEDAAVEQGEPSLTERELELVALFKGLDDNVRDDVINYMKWRASQRAGNAGDAQKE